MILNFIDEVLAGVPKFRITHADNSTEEVSIDLATTVTTQGTPLNKVLFDKIDKYLVPVGIISMWSGSINNIPNGWALCNGQNGTPDLRDKFIVGAGNEYTVGSTGGEKNHVLTENEMPSHTHNTRATWDFVGDRYANNSGTGNYLSMNTGASTNHLYQSTSMGNASKYIEITSKSTGNGQAHENRPPYFALCFIMKISN